MQPLLDPVEPTLCADHVRLTENTGFDGVRGIFGQRRWWERQPLAALRRKCEATPRGFGGECAERVAQTRVDHHRPLVDASRNRLVVDYERLVLLLDAAALKSVVALQVVAGARTLDVLRERFALELDL